MWYDDKKMVQFSQALKEHGFKPCVYIKDENWPFYSKEKSKLTVKVGLDYVTQTINIFYIIGNGYVISITSYSMNYLNHVDTDYIDIVLDMVRYGMHEAFRKLEEDFFK